MERYAVGTKCFSFTDFGRPEVLGPAEGNRKIAVRMYYPVRPEDAAGSPKAKVFSEKKEAAIRKAYHVKGPFQNEADYYEGLDPVPGERFPLVLFSHGYGGFMEGYTRLLRDLAAHGYIVASIGHAYEAIETDYEDGTADYMDKSLQKKTMTPYLPGLVTQLRILKRKGSDADKAAAFDRFQRKYSPFMMERVRQWELDSLAALEEVKARYGEHLDLSHGVAASGHSFGGATAYDLCQNSDEISCGLNIDGAIYGDFVGKTMAKPFYQIGCQQNYNVITRAFVNKTAPAYYAGFHDMAHMGFTDLKFAVPLKFLVGKLPPETMHAHLLACHTRFLDKYLKDIDNPVIQADDDAVSYRIYL